MEKKNPIEEARRYVDNAKALLLEYGDLDVETRSYNDRKILRLVTLAYENMHIYMGYDGNRNKDLSDSCFRMANDIIDHCETMLPKANV